MGADCQELGRGRGLQAHALCSIEIASRHRDLIAEGSVGMHAEYLNVCAAIRLALAAGDTVAARKIGVDDDRRADCHGDAVTGFQNRRRDLVPHHARIFEERMLALEDVVVSATDADMTDRKADPAG